ncbi:MAG: ribulose-phosphate 3-epimerase [Anaerolineaceae bacterium]|nr:MAG: ribulose-phosphate 3-epimerase [Anaerolineaceae bacterium]
MINFLIAPSILSADFTRLGADLAACESAGADWIHVDVMDGHFVPNLTMGPFVVGACRRATKLPLDVHLMIEEPERHIEAFAKAGATNITVHVETCPHLHRTIQQIHALGCKAGVTLNPSTPASAIEPVLALADLVLVLTVNPGFSGQKFLPEVLPKIRQLRGMLDSVNPSARLEVDGGLSSATLPEVQKRGADVFVSGSFVFGHPQGIEAGVRELRECVAPNG